jgi:hypothetical protein
MDRCGLADRICAGSGWVRIRPGAVEDFPAQMLSAYRFQVKLGPEGKTTFTREGRELLWRAKRWFTRAA